jgi:hypothetical protein
LLDEQDVAGLGVGQQPEKLRPGQLRAAFVLDIRSNDVEAKLGRPGARVAASRRIAKGCKKEQNQVSSDSKE